MKESKINLRFGVITLIVLATAFSRLLPHPSNFSPVIAMALFGGAYYSNKVTSFLVPLLSMWLSDMVLNYAFYQSFVPFYSGFMFTYVSIGLIVLFGSILIKKVKPSNVILASLISSIFFFLVSNLGVWASTIMYTKDIAGLTTCYIAGLPFFQNAVLGDLVYSVTIFGLFELAQRRIPSLQLQKVNN